MKKPKPKPLLERLPFPNLRSISLLSKSLPEEEKLKHEAEVKAHNDAVINNLGGVSKSMLTLNEAIIDVKEG